MHADLLKRVKPPLRWMLEKTVNRPKFNDSLLYRLYYNAFYPLRTKAKAAEIEFYRHALANTRSHVVFDIGANIGAKTAVFLTLADKVVSVEPNPAAVDILRSRFSHNPRVHIVAKGVGFQEGNAQFYEFEVGADPYNTFSDKWVQVLKDGSERPKKSLVSVTDIEMTTIDRLIQEYGLPSYIKIDVEGYELQAVRGLSKLMSILSFECNLPEFTAETLEIIATLYELAPNVEYNFITEDQPAKFESERWMTQNSMMGIVARGDYRFMEIFCRPTRWPSAAPLVNDT